ncbi:hypothetical protein BGZ76_004983 [Entomortierella beljakovae]|nr:hypothetical protein BGZ76_004983 [Entomortierella beljakovae]
MSWSADELAMEMLKVKVKEFKAVKKHRDTPRANNESGVASRMETKHSLLEGEWVSSQEETAGRLTKEWDAKIHMQDKQSFFNAQASKEKPERTRRQVHEAVDGVMAKWQRLAYQKEDKRDIEGIAKGPLDVLKRSWGYGDLDRSRTLVRRPTDSSKRRRKSEQENTPNTQQDDNDGQPRQVDYLTVADLEVPNSLSN